MTKVLFDISHPAHVNFFSNLINQLIEKGVTVDVVTLERGALLQILDKEYSTIDYEVVNRHRSNFFGLILHTGIFRTLTLLKKYLFKSYDVFIGVAAVQLALLSKFKNTKSIIFYDDPEYKLNYLPSKLMADVIYMPRVCNVFGQNVSLVNCSKEWSYLSPKYFKPNSDVLNKYGVEPYKYIFVREVSNETMNYRSQKNRRIELIHEMDFDYPVLFSLEDHERKNLYHKWTLLQEPVDDIHSLMYFSNLIISDGDSMAREGALLGNRSIYCGNRNMRINKELIQRGLLTWVNHKYELEQIINSTVEKSEREEVIKARQDSIRSELFEEWTDINNILFNEIISGVS